MGRSKKERTITLSESQLKKLIQEMHDAWSRQLWDQPFIRDALIHYAEYLKAEKALFLDNWWPDELTDTDDDEDSQFHFFIN